LIPLLSLLVPLAAWAQEPESTETEAAPTEAETASDAPDETAKGEEEPAPGTAPEPVAPAPVVDDAGRVRAAEARRLRGELVQVAKASRHDAVDRLYKQLVDIDEPIPADIHQLGADAARARGDLLRTAARLHRAEADDDLADLASRFGTVRLSVPLGASLTGEERFAPDEIASVQWTVTELARDGRYVGLLPAGTYQVAGRDVVVPAGGHVAVVVD